MSMEECRSIAAGLTAVLVFIILLKSGDHHPRRIILKQYQELSGLLREKQRNSTWYQRRSLWLNRNGAEFHYGRWVNPVRYLVLQLLLAFPGVVIMGRLSGVYGLLSGALLFFLPEWLLVCLNKQDNIRMLSEIKLVYQALELQIKAGVYVTDALAECYGSVREKRLQQALLDLAGQIVMKSDLYEALDGFQKKFANPYIDVLCITISQACESGQALELLSDISEQLKDMETAVMNAKKNSLDRSITFYQLGILVSVLIVVVYACVSYLFTEAVKL